MWISRGKNPAGSKTREFYAPIECPCCKRARRSIAAVPLWKLCNIFRVYHEIIGELRKGPFPELDERAEARKAGRRRAASDRRTDWPSSSSPASTVHADNAAGDIYNNVFSQCVKRGRSLFQLSATLLSHLSSLVRDSWHRSVSLSREERE